MRNYRKPVFLLNSGCRWDEKIFYKVWYRRGRRAEDLVELNRIMAWAQDTKTHGHVGMGGLEHLGKDLFEDGKDMEPYCC